jgi:hypothetical protein
MSEPPGENCAEGGVAYISESGVEYVCNGASGPAGPAGGILTFAYFYALMPPDNPATVAPGAAVEFPRDGPVTGISRIGTNQFVLLDVGVYEVFWQVSVNEAGQLVLGLDTGSGVQELPETVAGRATGTSQITNQVLITTTQPNTILTVRNPSGNTTALTVTPIAGGTRAVSAALVIKQLQ